MSLDKNEEGKEGNIPNASPNVGNAYVIVSPTTEIYLCDLAKSNCPVLFLFPPMTTHQTQRNSRLMPETSERRHI